MLTLYNTLCPKLAKLRYLSIQQNHILLNKHFSWCKTSYSAHDNQKDVKRMVQAFKNGDGAYFGIVIDSIYIGEIALDAIYTNTQSANVCYWISEQQQGKGFAKTALLHLKNWSKSNTHLDYLEIRMKASNYSSEKVAISAGAVLVNTTPLSANSEQTESTIKEYHLKL